MTTDTAKQVFDIAAFEVADTATFELENQKGEPLLYQGCPVTVELYGPGSAQYARAQAKINAASQARAMAVLRGKQGKDGEADMAESRKLSAERLAACTKALHNFPVPGGPLAVYSNPKLGYITNQVAKLIDDWANFPSASTTN